MRQNRSFVIRQARMSPHQREAYDRLSPHYCIPVEERRELVPFSWEEVFPHRARSRSSERPIIVDIGFGMGNELAEIAGNTPESDFLGVEVHKPGVGRLLGEIERRGLTNVRVVRYDAVVVCGALIPPGTVDGVHLFFPDPWPKKRHHKRRLVRPGFPELIAAILKSEGYFYTVTDWRDYAEQMVTVLEGSSALVNRYPARTYAPPQPWRPQTAFERKGIAKGHEIYELVYQPVR